MSIQTTSKMSNKSESQEKKETKSEDAAASALTTMSIQDNENNASQEEEDDDFELPTLYTRSGRKRAVTFPQKLLKVLSKKEFHDIITWLPNGKSFTILRPKPFVAEILPVYFKEAKYSSFTRKLHRWGFQRHLRGPETGAFFHKMFQKGRLDLVMQMTCSKPTSGNSTPPRGPSMVSEPVSLPRIPHAQSFVRDAGTAPVHNMQLMPDLQMKELQMKQSLQQNRLQPGLGLSPQGTDSMNPMFLQQMLEGAKIQAMEEEMMRRIRQRMATAALSRQMMTGMQPGNSFPQQGQSPPPQQMDTHPLQLPGYDARGVHWNTLGGGIGVGNASFLSQNLSQNTLVQQVNPLPSISHLPARAEHELAYAQAALAKNYAVNSPRGMLERTNSFRNHIAKSA